MKNILYKNIKNAISPIIGDINDIRQFENALFNKVYFINATNGKYVIKIAIGDTKKQELKREKYIIKFLENKMAVPTILMYNEFDGISYVLMEYIEGKTLQNLLSDNNTDKISRIHSLGQTLNEIHKIKLIEHYNYFEILNCQLQKAESNMNNNLLDPEEFIIDGTYLEPKQVLNELTIYKTEAGDICLLHGDFRPKNIIYNEKNVVIDWGFYDIGDPYYDIAIILYYFNQKEQAAFLNGYGIQSLDYARLRYFDYLSKFINV